MLKPKLNSFGSKLSVILNVKWESTEATHTRTGSVNCSMVVIRAVSQEAFINCRARFRVVHTPEPSITATGA